MCFNLQLALVVKYGSARLALFCCLRERRNFTVCICISQDCSAGRTLLYLTFLTLKFAVADVSVHATLNFYFMVMDAKLALLKIKILPCLRSLIL